LAVEPKSPPEEPVAERVDDDRAPEEADRLVPTRLVADRIADAPREPCKPALAVDVPASPPLAPPGDAAALVEAMAALVPPELELEEPPEELELLPPPEEPRLPPELNDMLSRPNPLRLPRIRGASRADALAAAVEPVNRNVRSNFPPRTVWVRRLACVTACSVLAWFWLYHTYPATIATTRPSRIIHP